MNMNMKSEEMKLQIKRDLIKKLDQLLLATGELRSQTDKIGTLLDDAHRIPKAA